MDSIITKDEHIAQHIWRNILQTSPLVLTWGFQFNTVRTVPNGTSFRVNTDFVIGVVKIQQTQQDCYSVTIKPDNYDGTLIYEDITPENLVSQIHRVIKEGVIVDNREPTTLHVA